MYLLGFSTGAMIYVSFIEIFIKTGAALENSRDAAKGCWWTGIAFFSGVFPITVTGEPVLHFITCGHC